MATAGTTPTTDSDPPAPESRVERKRLERTRRILDETASVLGRQGLSRFSLDEVAEQLDVTKGSLYHYFPSKEELVISAIERLAARIMDELTAEIEGSEDTATEKLRSLLAKQISVIIWEYPASVELFTIRDSDDVSRRAKALRAAHDALFRKVLGEGLASGEFRLASATASLECIYSSINMAPLWIDRKSRAGAKKQVNELIETLMMLVGVIPDEARLAES